MTWLWIVVAVLVLAGGALIPVFAGRGRGAAGDGPAIAARAVYESLGGQVENPVATTDPAAATLLHQARERWDSAGAILASATSTADFRLAERVAREGLEHVAAARRRMAP